MVEEYNSIMVNDVWEVVPRPQDRLVVGSKWIYKIKYVADDIVEKYKAGFVAKGYAQKEGLDYEVTFAPLARLRKALYGLKQAPRAWYGRIDGYLQKMGFVKSEADPNLYYLVVENEPLILVFLAAKGEIFLGQGRYATEILKRFRMEDCRSMATPMITNWKKIDASEDKDVDPTLYRQLIGVPDISGQYQARHLLCYQHPQSVHGGTKEGALGKNQTCSQIGQEVQWIGKVPLGIVSTLDQE
eukprot:PITA_01600